MQNYVGCLSSIEYNNIAFLGLSLYAAVVRVKKVHDIVIQTGLSIVYFRKHIPLNVFLLTTYTCIMCSCARLPTISTPFPTLSIHSQFPTVSGSVSICLSNMTMSHLLSTSINSHCTPMLFDASIIKDNLSPTSTPQDINNHVFRRKEYKLCILVRGKLHQWNCSWKLPSVFWKAVGFIRVIAMNETWGHGIYAWTYLVLSWIGLLTWGGTHICNLAIAWK